MAAAPRSSRAARAHRRASVAAGKLAPDGDRRGRCSRSHLFDRRPARPRPADPHQRRAAASATSCCGSAPMPSWCSSTRCGPTSAKQRPRSRRSREFQRRERRYGASVVALSRSQAAARASSARVVSALVAGADRCCRRLVGRLVCAADRRRAPARDGLGMGAAVRRRPVRRDRRASLIAASLAAVVAGARSALRAGHVAASSLRRRRWRSLLVGRAAARAAPGWLAASALLYIGAAGVALLWLRGATPSRARDVILWLLRRSSGPPISAPTSPAGDRRAELAPRYQPEQDLGRARRRRRRRDRWPALRRGAGCSAPSPALLGRCSARWLAIDRAGRRSCGIGGQATLRREGFERPDPRPWRPARPGRRPDRRGRRRALAPGGSLADAAARWLAWTDATARRPRRVTILGSTGSVGCSTLDLIGCAARRASRSRR